MLHFIAKGVTVADAAKVAEQLTLRWAADTRETNTIINIVKGRECFLVMVREGCDSRRRVREMLGTCFEDSGRGP